MPELITIIYLFYMFVSLYMLSLYLLIYIPNKKDILSSPKITKEYSLSMVIPCYNAEKNIGKTIEKILESDYKNLKKIIVVDDCSRDNSYEIIKTYAKKYEKVIAVQTPKNTGNAAGAKNFGAKFVETELIGFTDDDSYPEKDAIRKMIGFFDEKNVGAVTSAILVKNRKKLIERLQSIEYRIIVFTRKLLGFIDAIYVTPGPLAIYRKKIFDETKGFDEKNLTEDIEITWKLTSRNYKIKMSASSKVETVVPDNIKDWFKQRLRWNVGGLQTVDTYKKTFLKRGMLGSFIIPFFIFSWFLGLSGLFIIFYRLVKEIIRNIISVTYSIKAETAILSLSDISLLPNVLIFFGITLLVLSFVFTIISLYYTKEENKKDFKRVGILSILGYMFIYLLAYPILLIISVYKMIRKDYSW